MSVKLTLLIGPAVFENALKSNVETSYYPRANASFGVQPSVVMEEFAAESQLFQVGDSHRGT